MPAYDPIAAAALPPFPPYDRDEFIRETGGNPGDSGCRRWMFACEWHLYIAHCLQREVPQTTGGLIEMLAEAQERFGTHCLANYDPRPERFGWYWRTVRLAELSYSVRHVPTTRYNADPRIVR